MAAERAYACGSNMYYVVESHDRLIVQRQDGLSGPSLIRTRFRRGQGPHRNGRRIEQAQSGVVAWQVHDCLNGPVAILLA